jgi:tetratricopeptide (TPR) repeat protein
LRLAIRKQPGSWKTHLRLGEFMYRAWRYDEALPAFEQTVGLIQDNAQARTYIGSIQIIDGDLAAAEEAFRASLELAPSRGAWRDLGLAFMYEGKFDDAIDALKRATEFEADDHWSRGDLADAYYYAGRTSDALMTYREARDLGEALLRTNERDWGTMARVAQYYQRLGDSDTAAAMIQAAREGGSSLPHVLTFSAVYSLEEGDRIAFVDDLSQAVAMGFPVQLIRFHPAFDSVRGDPGFEALLKRQEGK